MSIVFAVSAVYPQKIADWKNEELKARALYNQGKVDEAIVIFREIILSSDNAVLKREAYYWISLAYINSGKYNLARNNLEYYLSNFDKTGNNFEDAFYQKGRLYFLEENFEGCIDTLDKFIKKYPGSKMLSNAYYWLGEALYALGRYDDAALCFKIVTDDYPRSAKSEASGYKLKLIDRKKSELALQNLLKWSQEQYLSSLNNYKTRELTLLQAIDELQMGSLETTDDSNCNALKLENERLQERLRTLEQSGSGGVGDDDLSEKMKQLELKALLLERKEKVLKLLEEELRARDAGVEKNNNF